MYLKCIFYLFIQLEIKLQTNLENELALNVQAHYNLAKC